MTPILCLIIVLVICAMAVELSPASWQPMALVSDSWNNEALVMAVTLSDGTRSLFQVDTAYAGPPVLSTSYLSLSHRRQNWRTMQEWYRAVLRDLKDNVSEDGRRRGLRSFVDRARCRSYTSGCTMRLMGIGATSEARADMLLCPALLSSEGSVGDVMVTNPLSGSPHILTTDYLVHRHPCVLCPSAQRLYIRLAWWRARKMRASFEFHNSPQLVGGAFSVVMTIGGTDLQIVIDTGAAAALSLSPDAISKLNTCKGLDTPQKAMQTGVNGERICSDILSARVRIGKTIAFDDVQVFANSEDIKGADGYAGMGLLRALDVWLSPHEIGFRRSGLMPSKSASLTSGSCDKRTIACAAQG